ncbi:hypothetical protein MKX03_033968 [Papaver bracteatum]|nr:hypothetical protein MKX03_033968 [Papaver bracteatum]
MSHKTSDRVSDGCKVEVYSLRSNSWRRKPYVYPYDLFLGCKAIKPVSYNGAPHWIGSSSVRCELSKAASIVIIYFDVENETFKEVPLTPELQESLCYAHKTVDPYVSYQPMFNLVNNRVNLIPQESFCHDHRTVEQCISYRSLFSNEIVLGIFGGCLSIVQSGELDSARNNHSDISIWIMKEYGMKESWTKMFSVSTQSIEMSLKYSTMTVMDFKNGKILFLKDKSSLVFYDPRDETTRVVNTGGLSLESCSSVDTYVESLVSLNSGIYLSQSVLASRPSRQTI